MSLGVVGHSLTGNETVVGSSPTQGNDYISDRRSAVLSSTTQHVCQKGKLLEKRTVLTLGSLFLLCYMRNTE